MMTFTRWYVIKPKWHGMTWGRYPPAIQASRRYHLAVNFLLDMNITLWCAASNKVLSGRRYPSHIASYCLQLVICDLAFIHRHAITFKFVFGGVVMETTVARVAFSFNGVFPSRPLVFSRPVWPTHPFFRLKEMSSGWQSCQL